MEYSFECKVRKFSKRTIGNYVKLLNYLANYMSENFGITTVERVRPSHIKNFLDIMDDKGRKARYINDLLKVYKTFFGYLMREQIIPDNPTKNVHNMKQPKVKILTFSEKDIRNLLNYFSGHTYLDIRNRAILALFFDTGMRLTEVTTLHDDQIHDDYILVHGKGNKERVVPVSPYLSKTLMQYSRAKELYFEGKLPERFFFLSHRGRQLTQEGISKFFKKAAIDIGINNQIRVSPHTCRHTFAHLQLKNGCDLYTLSRLMGHENIAITQRYLEGIRDDEVLSKGLKSGVLSNL